MITSGLSSDTPWKMLEMSLYVAGLKPPTFQVTFMIRTIFVLKYRESSEPNLLTSSRRLATSMLFWFLMRFCMVLLYSLLITSDC